jgi:hypothetical protein
LSIIHFDFISRPEARPHVVFLSDYDMDLTEQLVQGVDVWLNTPRRFLDIGGVLLTNGWDHHARKRAATLELAEMEQRPHLTFDTYEESSPK